VFDRLHAASLTSAGACGDTVRNITGCPVAGLAHDELFDPTPVVEAAAAHFYGNPDYSDLPRKHKIAITACADSCAAPEINCVALIGALRDGEEGFGVLVGGGLSSVPRIARELGIWVPKDEAVPVLAAILDAWREDLRYRVSRVKARIKFMVDDIGPEGVRERVEQRLGRSFDDFTLPPSPPPRTTSGVHEQSGRPLYVGVPVHSARLGRPADRVADWPELGGDVASRASRTFVANVGRAGARRGARLADRLPLDADALRGDAIACTGEPHCNFSVTETKTRLGRLVAAARAAVRPHDRRPAPAPRRLPARVRAALGRRPRLPGHDRARRGGQAAAGVRHLRRGGLGPARDRRPLFRRVPTEELDAPSRARRRLVERARRTRASGVLATARRRRARRARGRSPRDGREEARVSVELIDELEAASSRRVRGREPESCSSGRSSASRRDRDLDRVPDRRRRALDMAYAIDPRSACSASTPAGFPRDVRADRAAARPLSRAAARAAVARRAERAAMVASTGRTSSTAGREPPALLQQCARCAAARAPRRLDAWITGLRRDQWATRTTSARSRSTTTTARS
jgi:hypothetical protein